MTMDFELEETQREIARLADQVLGRAPDGALKELARFGLLGLAVPAGLGGDGLGILDVAVLLTEVGRHAANVPALATLATGVLPVVQWGDAALHRALLPAVSAGEAILSAAIREPGDPFPARPVTQVSDGTVTGTKIGVPYAAQAAAILVAASLGENDPATAVVLVDPAADGVTLTRTHTVSGAPEYTVSLRDAQVTATLAVGGVRDLYRLAIAGACAVADGALGGAVALTSTHVATREQFGRKLAEFQAVSQQIADIYTTARIVHLTTLAAIWKLAAGKDADDDLDTATWWITEEAGNAVMIAHHLHGGIGVDNSYPLPRYSALIADLSRFLGGTSVH